MPASVAVAGVNETGSVGHGLDERPVEAGVDAEDDQVAALALR